MLVGLLGVGAIHTIRMGNIGCGRGDRPVPVTGLRASVSVRYRAIDLRCGMVPAVAPWSPGPIMPQVPPAELSRM